MDIDKIERELENKFAAKDVASTESHKEMEPLVNVVYPAAGEPYASVAK